MTRMLQELETMINIPVLRRSFEEYCNIFGFNAENGEDFEDKKILDVGIGHSTFARYVNNNFGNGEVIGIDLRKVKRLSPLEVADLTEPKETKFPQAQTVVGDARQLPFAEESFDEVISSNLAMYLRKGVLDMIKEMARVCKKGGKIRITPTVIRGDPILKGFSKENILQTLRPGNFEIEEIPVEEDGHGYETMVITKLAA